MVLVQRYLELISYECDCRIDEDMRAFFCSTVMRVGGTSVNSLKH